ncbi:MAG: ABC transporter ATP-binding protein [Armatimonadetes bacterium]|nr:ABC transporter ATP-binding protein [Armatimonadota bacterium]
MTAPLPITRARLSRVAQHFKPYWLQWIAIILCIAATSGLGVLPPLCVRGILDNAIPDKDSRLLSLLVGAIVALTVVSSLISVLQNYLNMRVGQGIMCDLRNHLYRHLQRQSLGFYTVTRAGEIVSRVNNDVSAVQGVVTDSIVSIVGNIFTLIATLIVIISMDPLLALLAIVVVPTFYLPTRYVGRVRHRLSRLTQEQQAELVAFMEERLNIGGILLTKLFGQTRADADLFTERNRQVMELNVKQAMAGRWLFMCLAVFSVLGPAAIYWYGGHQAIRGELSVGTIIAFVAYLSNLYRPVGQLANVYVNLQGALAVFERIYEYLDRRPEVDDSPNAVQMRETKGAISFHEVSFEYPKPPIPPGAEAQTGDTQPVTGEPLESEAPEVDRRALKDVSFDIEPGQRVALVGPSGAGKTTVTYLIPRFYDPTEGKVTLDGKDLRDITQDTLRSHIATVTQDTFLFHATVRDNLLYARPGATDDEIVAATKAANIHDFITELSDGYDTIVGERGFRLSGGEKQRLAIARALLKDPRILILDEATSNLDATSEYLIQQALEVLLKGRTAVIIAHRLSTILTADRIIVLDRGRVVESGRHSELLAAKGLYAKLYRQQFEKVVGPEVEAQGAGPK